MQILHIASECAPFAKVGGLSDVVYGLAKAQKKDHQVQILLPKYDTIDTKQLKGFAPYLKPFSSQNALCQVWKGVFHNLEILLLDMQDADHLFTRGLVYGFDDDTYRFARFCRAAYDFIQHNQYSVEIVHLHDWPLALFTAFPRQAKTVLTIHNLQYQGRSSLELLHKVQIPTLAKKAFLEADYVCLLRGGITLADAVTVVSPTYLKEIMTVEGGAGLHELLQQHKGKLTGILNGIDTEYWNPRHDPLLPFCYDIPERQCQKKMNKDLLRKQLGMSLDDKPLVIAITRLATQKSPHLLQHALKRGLEKNAQFILLGAHPEPSFKKEFESMSHTLKSHPHARVFLGQDETLAHELYGSADFIIVPSLFEPCGLTQLISMRYGGIPIVRKTGGLQDTVYDLDALVAKDLKNGFTFDFPDPEGVNWALDRAVRFWFEHNRDYQSLADHVMSYDFSWEVSAKKYEDLYKKILR